MDKSSHNNFFFIFLYDARKILLPVSRHFCYTPYYIYIMCNDMQDNTGSIIISVVIPVYQYCCMPLVSALSAQLEANHLSYEIIVIDDGSTSAQTITANRAIASLPHATYTVLPHNVGRAAIRNILANRASGEWLLFLDCDVHPPLPTFISTYLAYAGSTDVVCGGVSAGENSSLSISNLRFRYERYYAPQHTATVRAHHPYSSFRTTNFMIRRSVMLANPFDERVKHYGYEDVLFGRRLQQQGCTILHIDNPVTIGDYESNDTFILKTEESLRTLHAFRSELDGYSRLLALTSKLDQFLPATLFRACYRIMCLPLRRHLTGEHPKLTLFNLYRLLYYMSLTEND